VDEIQPIVDDMLPSVDEIEASKIHLFDLSCIKENFHRSFILVIFHFVFSKAERSKAYNAMVGVLAQIHAVDVKKVRLKLDKITLWYKRDQQHRKIYGRYHSRKNINVKF